MPEHAPSPVDCGALGVDLRGLPVGELPVALARQRMLGRGPVLITLDLADNSVGVTPADGPVICLVPLALLRNRRLVHRGHRVSLSVEFITASA